MAYFNEIADYATYSGHEANFHFTYNANSGGGQAFLGGRFYDKDGQLTSPETLNGKIAIFRYVFRVESGEELSVIINDDKAKYEIKPRGNGSTSMKLGIGTDRIAPSKVVSAFMMLPPTCGVKMPSNLQLSILSANNYWLQSMWLDCNTSAENEVVFTVKDCVFGGGVSKETEDRTGRYFKLNIEQRMADIIALSNITNTFNGETSRIIKLFSDIYLGNHAFNYEECAEATKTLMELLAQQFPDIYSGITDPVSALLDITRRKHCVDADNSIILTNAESAFREWLFLLPKSNGEPYSENTRNQYISALKAVASQFPNAIAPFTTVFEITDADLFEKTVAAIKSDNAYEEFNRSRGNGSLSAGLDLYARFLREKNSTTGRPFTPAWFQKKAAEYPTLDDEAEKLLTGFQTKFNPEYLASLSGIEMLNTVFLNATNAENLCRVLEFDPQIKDTFGSIKGGNAYKYGLYYSTQGTWMTGSHQKPRQLTEAEAVVVGAKLRDHLVAGANAISEYGPLVSIDDYKKLHQILRDVTEGDIERVWFLKYYQMLYPELFATNYSDYAQRTVLAAIREEKEKYPFVRMGQIRLYANKCGISNVMFNKIFWDNYSEEANAAKAEPSQDICYNTGYQSDYPRNRILFGAPGTGKSFTLNHEKDLLLVDGGEYERVTFHPDYSYANFVGTYKPVPCMDNDKDTITYSYVPGPFMRTYVKALQNSRTDAPKPFLLVIEEINRANVAAVFGDVFQLLDRGDDEVSEYPIQASEDIKKYLAVELGGKPDDYSEIRIPDNMFIWATMNSADQGVFPMDTAFKRRWDFTYLGIDDSEAGIVGKKVILGQGDYRRIVEWNALRKAINDELLTYKVNEDKLMGPYFISKKNLPEGEMIDAAVFTRIFKNKVIMYLFDDAAKQKRITLFGGCDEKAKNQYSKICREFDTKGVYIFCEGISSQFIDNVPEDDGE